MPKVFTYNGYRFHFFSNEQIPREPCHIHVKKAGKQAKFWVNPYVSLASAYEMSSRELLELERVIQRNVDLVRRKWDEHFGG